jgi:hypothetical protein
MTVSTEEVRRSLAILEHDEPRAQDGPDSRLPDLQQTRDRCREGAAQTMSTTLLSVGRGPRLVSCRDA